MGQRHTPQTAVIEFTLVSNGMWWGAVYPTTSQENSKKTAFS
jgi:hypothetical protein